MNRNTAIDYLKSLGIILVVAGHTDSPFLFYIYSFHMGLFFFISGFLVYGKTYDSDIYFIKKRFKTLIVPYIVFWCISFVVENIESFFSEGNFISMTAKKLSGLIFGGQYLYDNSINFPIWYLQTSFIVAVVFYYIVKFVKSDVLKLCLGIGIFFATLPIQGLLPERPAFHINVLPPALVFMTMGYFVSKYKDKMDKIPFIVGIAAIIPGYIIGSNNAASIANLYSYPYFLCSILTVCGWYLVVKNLPTARVVTFIGSSTIYILGLHFLMLKYVNPLVNNVMRDNAHLACGVKTTIIVTTCCLIGVCYLNLSHKLFTPRKRNN